MKLLKEVYAYREMIFSLVRRDLKGRYKGSVLGFFWTFLNPLLQLLVYTFVFSIVMRAGVDDYALFLFVVLVPWMFFSTSITGGTTCVWAQKDMVKKIYFPREVLPISFVTSQFINMLLSFIVVFIVLFFSGKGINLFAIVYLPLIMLLEYSLALGGTFLVSSINVYFRDLEYVCGILVMALQFLSPVMYSVEQVPNEVRFIFELNPLTSILKAYRDILYYKQIPQLSTLTHAIVFSVICLAVGCLVFEKLKKKFAEEM